MDKKEIKERLQEIFRDIFDMENLVLNESTGSDDIEEWDSLNHINLIVAVEKEFRIKFDLEEPQKLTNAGAIIDAIAAKLE